MATFESLENLAASAFTAYDVASDLALLQYLKYVSPLADANLMVIYGSMNRMDTTTLTTSELTTLAAMHKTQLNLMVVDAVRDLVSRVMSLYVNKFTDENTVVFLPEPVYRSFRSVINNLNMIRDRVSNVHNEAYLGVLQGINHSFVDATVLQPLRPNEERIPVDPANIRKLFEVLFDEYTTVFEHYDPSRFNELVGLLVRYASNLIRILAVGTISFNDRHFTRYDDADEVYRRFVGDRFNQLPNRDKFIVRKARCLEPAHVVAMKGGWIEGLAISQTPMIRDNTASKMQLLLMEFNRRLGG